MYDIKACLSVVGQLIESGTHVETGTSLFVGLKRLTKLVKVYATRMNLYNLVFRMVFLIVRYINKWPRTGEAGWWMVDTATIASAILVPGLNHNLDTIFFTNFCTNSYKRIHTIVIQIVYYEFVHDVVFVPIHTIFIRIIVRIHTRCIFLFCL